VIGLVLVGIATAQIFVGYTAIAVLLGLGPLFILCALFPSTQRFFEAWLGQVVNYVLNVVLVTSVVAMAFHFFTDFMQRLNLVSVESQTMLGDPTATLGLIMGCIKLVGVGFAIAVVFWQVNSIAAALGGGVALQVMRATSRGFSWPKSDANPTGTNRPDFNQVQDTRPRRGNPFAGLAARRVWSGA
jgi:type IV secretion system protein VirB6